MFKNQLTCHFRDIITIAVVAIAIILVSAQAYAAPKPKVATDLDCLDCVDTNEIVDGTITSSDISPEAVTGDKIAPGAVTADKIAPDAIADHPHNILDIDYSNTLVVNNESTSLTLQQAFDAINDAVADNQYVIKIEPGIYDLEGLALNTKPFVHMVGSGQGVTTIQSAVNGAVVNVSANSSLRSLTVMNTTDSGVSVAIMVSGESPSLSDVTAIGGNALGSESIRASNCNNLEMMNVTAIGRDYGLIMPEGDACTALARNSRFFGNLFGVFINEPTSFMNIVHSQVSRAGGTGKCFGVYDANLDPLAICLDPPPPPPEP